MNIYKYTKHYIYLQVIYRMHKNIVAKSYWNTQLWKLGLVEIVLPLRLNEMTS